jgi:NAD(P)-dependent dehydrogenase (short-subunit alcohol dehydrogenase family)
VNEAWTVRGRTVMVTGATDGIGMETARELARHGARVLLHGRDARRAAAARREICASTGNDEVQVLLADFASLGQVRALADEVHDLTERLHVLVDNAGVYQERRHLTQDGLETTFQVNYLAPFLLTNLLLDPLLAAAPARIVVVSSAVHQRAPVDLTDLQGERRYDGYSAYGLSKLGNLLFTYELAERLRGTGVTVNALHPGAVSTKLLHAGFRASGGASPREGARTAVYLATSPDVEGMSGGYFVDERRTTSSPASYSRELRAAFWSASERLTGLAGYFVDERRRLTPPPGADHDAAR